MLCFVDDGFSFGSDNFFYWFGFVEGTKVSPPSFFNLELGLGVRACVGAHNLLWGCVL